MLSHRDKHPLIKTLIQIAIGRGRRHRAIKNNPRSAQAHPRGMAMSYRLGWRIPVPPRGQGFRYKIIDKLPFVSVLFNGGMKLESEGCLCLVYSVGRLRLVIACWYFSYAYILFDLMTVIRLRHAYKKVT